MALVVCQSAATLALAPAAHLHFFGVVLATIFFCLGGIFSLGPPISSALFGRRRGPHIYGYLFSAFPCAALLGHFGGPLIVARLGYEGLCACLGLTSLLALIPILSLTW